ncbi:MAG: ParA family protein [Gammaproteobacteria bacterium]|jgi:chromosome partitioning protein|nr:MAG: ParA family protein [Gammaproteobacteria bacterium]
MLRIVVLNPKGGSGKTTLATGLAAMYAARGLRTVLMDFDPQGSSMRWLEKRPPERPAVAGIAAYTRNLAVTRSFQLRIPPGTDRVIVDTPAALEPLKFHEHVRDADVVLVPVLPSDIDIHACSRCIGHLLIEGKVKRRENRLGVVATRVKPNTIIFRTLMKFLDQLQIPVITTLRDAQCYVHAAEMGLGVHDMKPEPVRPELTQWEMLYDWIESRVPSTEADPAPLERSQGS